MHPLWPEGTEARDFALPTQVTLRTYLRGPKRGAPTVLFLHGFPEMALSFREQMRALSDTYRCVAPDMRGYGHSSKPPRVADYDIALLCADIVALIDALGADKVHLVGHDWGAGVAWEVARRRPDKVRTLSSLNGCSGNTLLRAMKKHPAQLLRSYYMLLFQVPRLAELLLKWRPKELMHAAFVKGAKNKAVFTDEALAPYIEEARRTGLHGGLNYYRAAAKRLLRTDKRRVDVPTRVVWGVDDFALGPWFTDPKLYAFEASNVDIVTIEGSGHWVQQEAADRVNRSLREHFERFGARAS
jgi:epoxide hydrolase 4